MVGHEEGICPVGNRGLTVYKHHLLVPGLTSSNWREVNQLHNKMVVVVLVVVIATTAKAGGIVL